jgi:Flp pilus assembly protein TadG
MVHNPVSRIGRRDDGAVAIITVILISAVFVGLAALVVDLGMARDSRRQAQNAADASALAAGNVVYGSDGRLHVDDAVNAAKTYALTNYNVTNWTNCLDPSALAYRPDPNNTCISFDSATAPMRVRVKVPIHDVSTPFAGIWAVSTVPVSAVAQIQFDTGGLAPCGLCVLGSGTHSLQEGHITVNGASVAINGTLDANNAGGSITVTGTGKSIDLQAPLPAKGTYLPQPVLVNQPPIVDPLASLIMPDYSALTVHAKTNTCPGVPGIYDHLIACAGMTPGLYVLTGVTGGNFGIVGNRVTLDLVCGTWSVPRLCATAGEVGGSLSFNGGGTLTITAPNAPPLPPEPNAGLAIVADPNNIATLSFGGNGAANSGTIYAARGTLQYNGNGALGTDSLIVVNDFSFAGTPSAFVSSYTQANNVTVPPSSMHLSQ